MELACKEYRLPEVRYYKGTFILDSESELTGVQSYRRPRPFWNYQENESEQACPPFLPPPLNLTSITYTGDRRRHPDLRMRLYEVLQHKA